MKLDAAKTGIDNVTEEQLRGVFADDRGRGEYVRLEQKDEVYLQASGEMDGPYDLEYREGDVEHHFRAEGEFRKEEVQQAFLSYLAGDEKWRKQFRWQKLEMKPKPKWKFW
ncbi:MAG TPA: hypothetical protein VK737_05875 [Opitutales bacterium]|jgi:hypothetical protein|nr:hypothetical protein [Opitutales bacterium]